MSELSLGLLNIQIFDVKIFMLALNSQENQILGARLGWTPLLAWYRSPAIASFGPP